MGRKILAVIVAWIVATATMMIIEMFNSTLFASPSEAVMKDPAALRAYMANGPVAAYVVVLIGYATLRSSADLSSQKSAAAKRRG